jgi:hypothetical protein
MLEKRSKVALEYEQTNKTISNKDLISMAPLQSQSQ